MNKYSIFVSIIYCDYILQLYLGYIQVLSALLAVATSAPIEAIVAVTEDTLGNYQFAFDSGDYIKEETRYVDGSIVGKYIFIDPEGGKHIIEYTAGAEQGVEAKGADIPIPVADTAENNAARAQFLYAYNAIESDPRFAESPADERQDPISEDEYLAALNEQLHPSVPLVFQADTAEIAAAKIELAAAHRTAIGQ